MNQARSTRIVRALLVVSLFGLMVSAAAGRSRTDAPVGLDAQPLAAVGWPPSTGLLVSEVVTGGTSASDEFIEIYNASSSTLDLANLELVYATSTGTTVTRKQTWTSLLVPAHRHVLIANSSGRWASAADGVYSGGLASTGGSAVLRVLGGAVIDSLSWGDASSAFVEGSTGAAPPASSSLERKPGGDSGNATDTNNNAADAAVNAAPVAQALSAGAVPSPTPIPTPTATPIVTATPAPIATPTATAAATDEATPEPTLSPEPTPPCTPDDMTPMPEATANPTPTSTPAPEITPAPTPSLEPAASAVASVPATAEATQEPASPEQTTTDPTLPVPTPTAAPTLPPLSVAEARVASLGSTVAVRVVLTTPFGLLDSGRRAYADDGTGGIALVTSFDPPALPVGTDMSVVGVLASHSGELAVEVESPADVVVFGSATPAASIDVATALACEPFESRLITVEGELTAEPGAGDDGVLTVIDDGSGALPVLAPNASGVQPAD